MTVPPPPGSTPPPPPPGSMPPVPPTGGNSNGTATAALVCGIVSLFCSGIVGVVAIILGIIGKKKASQLNGEGSGQAIAGIVLGSVSIVFSILFAVIMMLGALGTKHAVENAEPFQEIKESQSRNGEVAKSSHYKISREDVEVDDYGYVTYSAYIENTADFATSFTIKVACTSDTGEKKTEKTYAYYLENGDKESIDLFFTFSEDTTSAKCGVTEVLYGT